MSAKVLTLREDNDTIIETALELAIESASRLRSDAWEQLRNRLHAVVSERLLASRLEDDANNYTTACMDLAARLGFFLAFTVASHGPLGDRAWLAEALRLAGEDVAVEVRQAEA